VFLALVVMSGCRTPTPAVVPPTDTPTPTPPKGYQVVGNHVLGADGLPHTFRGITLPGLEWYRQEWGFESYMNRETLTQIRSWGANVVRFPLHQRAWRENGEYVQKVLQLVKDAEELDMDVILDLRYSERGDPSISLDDIGEPEAPDIYSIGFWASVSALFKEDPRVLFEIYSEPHDITPSVWAFGGNISEYVAIGMQELIVAIRDGGSQNLIIVNGLDWGLNHSSSPRLTGNNLVYGTHPFTNWPESDEESEWEVEFGFLSVDFPIMLSSFGNIDGDCRGDGASSTEKLLTYAESKGASWVAWAWFVGGCEFPSLISHWDGTPTLTGEVVKKFLRLNP